MRVAFRDEFAAQVIRASSPSEKASLAMRGTGSVEVSFAPGYYGRASTSDMELQLSRAARLLFVERTRAMYAGLSAEAGERIQPGSDREHPRARAYREGLDEVTAEGASPGGEVTLTGIGLGAFTVRVVPGTLERLSEDDFRAACASAGEGFMRAYEGKIALLKFDVYYRDMAERHGLDLGL